MPNWKDMLDVGFNEIGKDVITMLTALVAADIGKPVKVSANGTVALAAAEDPFIGVLDLIDSSQECCAVQDCGYVTLPYTGAPALNRQELVANGDGGVKPPTTAGTGRMYFIVNKDTTATTVTFRLC